LFARTASNVLWSPIAPFFLSLTVAKYSPFMADDLSCRAPLGGRVIKVMHVITGLRRGGAEHCLLRLVQRMDRDRFSTSIVTILPLGPLAEEIKNANIKVATLNCSTAIQMPLALWRLVRKIREFKPDIVQTWLYHADVLGTLAALSSSQVRLVWNVRNSEPTSENRRSWRFMLSMLALLSRSPDCIVANSRAGIEAHVQAGYKPSRWICIPNGWSIPDRQKAGRRDELGLPVDDVLIGLIARLAKQKDFDNFLSATALLRDSHPNLKFVLMGSGVTPEALRLHRFASELQQRLIFLGERSDLDRILPSLDAVTLTSAYGEGVPNSLGEAMAAGLPVIATDVGDTRYLLTAENWLVPPRSPEALANAWTAFASLDQTARHAIGANNQKWIAAHYQIDDMVRKYENVYASIMHQHIDDHEVLPDSAGSMNGGTQAFKGSNTSRHLQR
jgi:glycosyltransferase involved in cell wall biosynthesis